MTAATEATVERLLREAAPAVVWPATPDLRSSVVARIGEARVVADAAPPRTAQRSRVRLAGAVALALVALLVLAGVAGALGFRLPGIDMVLVERLPPAGSGLDLGSPIPLDTARGLERPRVLLPSTLPAPDVAYVIGAGDRTIVTLAWRASSGERVLPGSDLSLSIMAVPGTTGEALATKMVGRDSTVTRVTVGGSDGWWISGAPHEIIVERPDGDVGVVRSSLAGDTLLFARDGTVYRLESTLGRDATVAIAEGLR